MWREGTYGKVNEVQYSAEAEPGKKQKNNFVEEENICSAEEKEIMSQLENAKQNPKWSTLY